MYCRHTYEYLGIYLVGTDICYWLRYCTTNSSIAVVVVWDTFVFVTRFHMLQAFIPAVTVHWGSGYDPARQGHALEACSFVHFYAEPVHQSAWQHCISFKQPQNVIPNESVSATAKPTKDVVCSKTLGLKPPTP